jgi:hypothetical protein
MVNSLAFRILVGAIQPCLDYRDALPSLQQLHQVELALWKLDLPTCSVTRSRTADDEPSEGMQVELKFEDGWYLGVVTGVDEVAGGTFSLVLF